MSRTKHLERDDRRTDRAERARFVRNAYALADILETIAERRAETHAAELAEHERRQCPECIARAGYPSGASAAARARTRRLGAWFDGYTER